MDSLSLFKAGAIFKRDARLALSYEAQFVMEWISVICTVLITYFISTLVPPSAKFGVGGALGTYFSYVIINQTFVGLQGRSLQIFAKSIRDGQLQGTLEIVLSTPTQVSLIVLSGGLWSFAIALVSVVVMLGVAVLLGLDLRHTNIATFSLFLLLTIASLVPLGVVSAAVTMVFKQSAPIDYFLNVVSYLFAGVYVPVSSLPPALQVIGWCLPITHALNGLRAAVAGESVMQVSGDLFWLLSATMVLLPLSLLIFNRAVKRAKIDGTLAGY